MVADRQMQKEGWQQQVMAAGTCRQKAGHIVERLASTSVCFSQEAYRGDIYECIFAQAEAERQQAEALPFSQSPGSLPAGVCTGGMQRENLRTD